MWAAERFDADAAADGAAAEHAAASGAAAAFATAAVHAARWQLVHDPATLWRAGASAPCSRLVNRGLTPPARQGLPAKRTVTESALAISPPAATIHKTNDVERLNYLGRSMRGSW